VYHIHVDDVDHSGTVVCRRVRFLFHDFVRAMLDASSPMVSFVSEFHAAIDSYQSYPSCDKDEEVIDRLQFLKEEFSRDWPDWVAESTSLLENIAT